MKRAALALTICLAAAPGFAAYSSQSRGTAAGTFLTLGGGARAAGMGGAQTSAATGASSVVWNPAAPAGLPSAEIEVMHGDWFEGASYEFASAVLPFGKGMAASLLYQQFGVGDLEGRDDAGFEEASFEPKDSAVGAGFAWSVNGYQFGATAKLVRSKIVSSAGTTAFDLGAMSPEINGRRWGLAATNLIGRLKYDSAKEDLPVTVSAGGQQRFGRHTVTADIKVPHDNRPYLAFGGEAGLPIGQGLEGLGRLGYTMRSGTEAGSLAGLSIGAGLKGSWFSLDYAFAPMGDLGSIHLFSLAIRGGGERR